MARSSAADSAAIFGGVPLFHDFSTTKLVVDVGGGQGSLLATVLKANPNAHGILYDRPEVVTNASPIEAAVLPDDCSPHPEYFMNINMMVLNHGGRERTQSEYTQLLDRAGFRLTQVRPTLSPNSIMEASPL
jgi:hypothetical protein